MNKLDDVVERDRLALVGVAKNCGKTTTLNSLLQLRKQRGMTPPALLSVGVDGESEDFLIKTKKPPIAVQSGQWLVSAERAIERSFVHVEYVRELDFSTPLGRVLICRVLDEGTVVLAGLRHREEVVTALQALDTLGQDTIWVDGAYGRVAGAHPEVTDAVVVATGAVAGRDVESIAACTESLISRLVLDEAVDPVRRKLIARAVDEGQVFLLHDERGAQRLSIKSAVVGLHRVRERWSQSIEAIAIPGLISDRVTEELLAVCEDRRRTLLVTDGTAFHIDDRLWQRLRRRWDIRALDSVDLAAISYNPTSPGGDRVPGDSLVETLAAIRADTPVFNPLQ